MDPASTIGLVFACYQVASEIGCQCFRYVRGVRQSKNDVDLVFTRIQTFQLSLHRLQLMLADEAEISYDQNRLEVVQEVMESQSTSLELCLKELGKILHGLSKAGTGGRCKELLQKLAWPLKQDEVDKALQTLASFATAVDTALAIDTSVTVRQIHSTSKTIEGNTNQLLSSSANAEAQRLQRDELRKQDEERREAMATREKILGWLTHPDVGELHNAVSKARKSTETGRWFLDGAVFQEFKETPRSLLWLHGDSGCGKSVICSAIVDQLKIMCRDSPRCRLAYWYFSVNDMRRRSLENLMRALITQFMPTSTIPPPILRLWDPKNNGRESATLRDLIAAFRELLAGERGSKDHLDIYLVIDALDESNEAEHADIIAMLQSLMLAIDNDMHLLITSRSNSITIGQGWHDTVKIFKVGIDRQNADEDILVHVTERLKNDEGLKKWCRKPKELNRALEEPPKDLRDFYAQELANVENNAVEDVRKLLVWMAFPQRPLNTQEVVEILAVDIKSDPPCFDVEDRMPRLEDILKLCGSLVSTNTAPDSGNTTDDGAETRHFTAAHASVVDFLQAGCIRIGSKTMTSFTKAAANLEMAETCLVYLLSLVEDENSLTEMDLLNYPFAHLSAKMWHNFYREVLTDPGRQELSMDRLRKLVIRLLTAPESCHKWVQLCALGTDSILRPITERNIMPAMYHAAILGLPDIVDCLLKEGHDVDGGRVWDCRTPLIGACRHGREGVVSVLLNNGADPNWSANCQERPLTTAMRHKHAEVVKILLNAKGIDVNTQEHHYRDEGGAQPKLSGFSMDIVSDIGYDQILLQHTWDGWIPMERSRCHPQNRCQTLLSVAAASRSLDFVKALLAAGVDANIPGGSEGTALEIACRSGRPDLVRCLLDGGAKLNIPGGLFGNPLQAACSTGLNPLAPERVVIVEILLDAGVDINREGGYFGTALIAACRNGHTDFVRMLLDRGADPNIAQCSEYERLNLNPLQSACIEQDYEMINLLLDNGADPNIHGGWYGSPLHAAFFIGNNAIIDMLLQRGADMKYEGGYYKSIFQAAFWSRRAATIKKALELDLSSNEKAGWLSCPLLQGTALRNSLESLSEDLSYQAEREFEEFRKQRDEKNGPLVQA